MERVVRIPLDYLSISNLISYPIPYYDTQVHMSAMVTVWVSGNSTIHWMFTECTQTPEAKEAKEAKEKAILLAEKIAKANAPKEKKKDKVFKGSG